MSSLSTRLAVAFDAAVEAFVAANPKSAALNAGAKSATPGGTTRNVLFMKPFPLAMASGDGAFLTSVDGTRYLDLCGEYSAALFGHSPAPVVAAMHAAIGEGIALGSVNRYEGRLAALLVERFPSLERVRFANSGTEATATCLALLRAHRRRRTFLVMEGGYHGGLTTFGTAAAQAAADAAFRSPNLPHRFVLAPYNDVGALARLVAENEDDLAAIVLEPMQGSAGCIPADAAFLQACRDQATASGAVLVFDEVMTSRMSVGGYQAVAGVTPDMTLLGKYLAGGGCNFGAFGGRAAIMDLLDPAVPGGLYHSGTYSNNVVTMAAGVAALEQLWTPAAATALWDAGVWLRAALNALAARRHSTLHVSGTGSLLAVHFTAGGRPVRGTADVQAGHLGLRELFFFDMLRRGFFFARRGQISLMTVHTRAQLDGLVAAVDEFLQERAEFVSLEAKWRDK